MTTGPQLKLSALTNKKIPFPVFISCTYSTSCYTTLPVWSIVHSCNSIFPCPCPFPFPVFNSHSSRIRIPLSWCKTSCKAAGKVGLDFRWSPRWSHRVYVRRTGLGGLKKTFSSNLSRCFYRENGENGFLRITSGWRLHPQPPQRRGDKNLFLVPL